MLAAASAAAAAAEEGPLGNATAAASVGRGMSPISFRSVTPLAPLRGGGGGDTAATVAKRLSRDAGASSPTLPHTRSGVAHSSVGPGSEHGSVAPHTTTLHAAGSGIQLLRSAASFRANPTKVLSFLGIQEDVGAVQRQIAQQWRSEQAQQRQDHDKIMTEAFNVAADAMTQRLWLSTMPFLPRTAHRLRGCEFCQSTPVHQVGLPAAPNCGVSEPIALCQPCYEEHFAWDPTDNGTAHRLYTWVSVKKLVGLHARQAKQKEIAQQRAAAGGGEDEDYSFGGGDYEGEGVEDYDDDEDRSWVLATTTAGEEDDEMLLIPSEVNRTSSPSTPMMIGGGTQQQRQPPQQNAHRLSGANGSGLMLHPSSAGRKRPVPTAAAGSLGGGGGRQGSVVREVSVEKC